MSLRRNPLSEELEEAAPNSSIHSLDTNLIILSERLANLVQALQDLTNRMNSGLSKKEPATDEMISKIPKLDFWETECPICLGPQEENLLQLSCGHVYHNSCLVNWLKQQRTCPQCRGELVD